MLAGERTAITDYQISRTIDEFCIFANPVFTLKIEGDTHVDAAMPEMAVECASIAVFVHELADVSEIASQLFGSHRRIVPAFPLRRCAGSKGGRARSGLAYLPHFTGFALRVQPDGGRSADIF